MDLFSFWINLPAVSYSKTTPSDTNCRNKSQTLRGGVNQCLLKLKNLFPKHYYEPIMKFTNCIYMSNIQTHMKNNTYMNMSNIFLFKSDFTLHSINYLDPARLRDPDLLQDPACIHDPTCREESNPHSGPNLITNTSLFE